SENIQSGVEPPHSEESYRAVIPMPTPPSQPVLVPEPARALSWGQGLHLPDRLFRLLCQGAALFVLVLLVALVGFLVAAAWPAITRFGLSFLVSQDWDPQHDRFGALTFVWGTIVTSALAMLLAVPLGIGAAAYLAEIAPGWTRRTGSFLIELLAAIPSVVYGF